MTGFIKDGNIAATAAIAVTKLAAGADNHVLATSGSTPLWVPSKSIVSGDTRQRPIPLLGRVFHGSDVDFSPNSYTDAEEGALYGLLVLNTRNATRVAGLKAGNPDIKVFLYIDVATADSTDTDGDNSGVPWSLANNGSNDAWFLTHSGTRIYETDFSTSYVMDPANTDYQAAVLANCETQFAKASYDGIIFDEINTLRAYYNPSQTMDAYTTDAAWQAAMYSFIKALVPALQAQGILVMANLGDDASIPYLFESWATWFDGLQFETWMDGGAGLSQQNVWWPYRYSNLVWQERNKKYTIMENHNTTEAGNVYGLAAMLLATQLDGYSFYDTSNAAYTTETLYTEYTTASGLGPAMGEPQEVEYRVYLRYFAFGLVVVNTTGSTSGTVTFGRACSGSGLTSQSSHTVAAYTAYILLYD